MSEQKPQGWFVPLRVRFRSATERAQWEHEHPGALAADDQTLQMQLPAQGPEPEDGGSHDKSGSYTSLRNQQIKELFRLGNVLHTEVSLNEVLQQIVTSVSACTGFRTLVIFLVNNLNDNDVEPGNVYVMPAAANCKESGASEAGERIVR